MPDKNEADERPTTPRPVAGAPRRTLVISSSAAAAASDAGGDAAGSVAASTPPTIVRPTAATFKPVDTDQVFDVIIIGAGPAGLSAGLNLVRARRRVLMIDSNRPRHAATLLSHGFITRDGVAPLELRRLGREEFISYDEASFHQSMVRTIAPVAADAAAGDATGDDAGGGELFEVRSAGIRGSGDLTARTRTVLIATGLLETLPALPSIRAYYGTSMHSCTECDGYEKSDEPLALIGETDDLAERALLLSQWSNDLIVFTNGAPVVTEADETALDARNIRVERRRITDIVGDRSGLTGVALDDGTVIPRTGGFVRPLWSLALDYPGMLGLAATPDGLLDVDASGHTSVSGIFAAGDSTPPGAQQLIVAAGEGARVAAAINRHLIGTL